MKNKLLIASASLFILSTSGYAATNTLRNSHRGFYLGGQIGYANLNNHNDYNPFSSNTSGAGINGFGGYQFNPYFALQGGITYLRVNGYAQHLSNIFRSDNINFTSYNAVSKFIWPVKKDFDLYVKGGLALAHTDYTYFNSTTNLRPTYGVGADFYVNHHLSLNAGWTQVRGKSNSTPTTNLIGLGLTEHFS